MYIFHFNYYLFIYLIGLLIVGEEHQKSEVQLISILSFSFHLFYVDSVFDEEHLQMRKLNIIYFFCFFDLLFFTFLATTLAPFSITLTVFSTNFSIPSPTI